MQKMLFRDALEIHDRIFANVKVYEHLLVDELFSDYSRL